MDESLRFDDEGTLMNDTRPVKKLSYFVPINVREERLNQLSDLAIGEAMGGPIGSAMAENARRNLAVLDEIDKTEKVGESVR